MPWYSIRPDDTFHIRDGRTFDRGSGSAYASVSPSPSTFGGALSAAIGGNEFKWLGLVVIAHRRGDQLTAYVPQPRDVVTDSEGAARLFPIESAPTRAGSGSSQTSTSRFIGQTLTDVDRDHGAEREWKHEPANVQLADLSAHLGDPNEIAGKYITQQVTEPFAPEYRTGITLEGRSAKKGHLYTTVHHRPVDGHEFLVWADLKGHDIIQETVPFGGAGRTAQVTPANGADILPKPLDEYPDGRLLLYLASPAVWADGVRPPLPEGAEIIAAVTGPAQPVAIGAKRRTGIRNTKLYWAVPAGSVFYIKFANPEDALIWAHEHQPGGAKQRENSIDALGTTGFGAVFTGKWRYARS